MASTRRSRDSARRFALIGVLVSEWRLAEIDDVRGELSRDEWCNAAFEQALARRELMLRYAHDVKLRRTEALRTMRNGGRRPSRGPSGR